MTVLVYFTATVLNKLDGGLAYPSSARIKQPGVDKLEFRYSRAREYNVPEVTVRPCGAAPDRFCVAREALGYMANPYLGYVA